MSKAFTKESDGDDDGDEAVRHATHDPHGFMPIVQVGSMREAR
jgi:hypothetical protein